MPNSDSQRVNQKEKVRSKKRDSSFDYLRGIAVFLMILAHTIHFFHNGSNQNLRFWEGVGNTVCFTTFLFVSGAVSSLAYLKDDINWREKKRKIFKRTSYLLIGYYIVAFAANVERFNPSINKAFLNSILETIFLIEVPGFTEFILPFIFYSLLIIIARPVLKFISRKLTITVITSAIIYLLGIWIFSRDFIPEPFNNYKALFTGSEGLYRFPILQYFPVFALGLWWGKKTKELTLLEKEKRGAILGVVFLSIWGLAYFLSEKFNLPFHSPFTRWPPSIGFMSIGLAFSFLLQVIIYNIQKLKILDPINRFFIYIGQDAFDMFLFSTLLVLTYGQLWGQKYKAWEITIMMFSVITGASMLIASINSLNSPSLFRKGTEIFTPYQRLFKKRFLVLAVFIGIISFGNLEIPLYADVAGTMVTTAEIKGVTPLSETDTIPWWHDEYGQYRQIQISNPESFISLPKDTVIELTIDHKKFVQLNKSTNSGRDLQIVYLNQDNAYEREQLETTIINPNSSETTILFKTINRIYPQSYDNRYFLYYENLLSKETAGIFSSPLDLNRGSLEYTDQKTQYEISLGTEEKHLLTTKLSHNWIVKSNKDKKNLVFSAQINDTRFTDTKISYFIPEINSGGEMYQADPVTYQAEIYTENLQPGGYTILALTGEKPNLIRGQSRKFVVSNPMYVSWTIDWEGYNEKKKDLDELENISANYNVPLTHFFNPRIYITGDVTQEQSEFMTNWVKDRKENHREAIGLHLHMHKDMVEAAGVEVKDGPRWARFKENDGYDIPTTEYSYEELEKIIDWGINQFEQNDLGTPQMYRAGGWFADMNLLRALEERNFWLDSSGRKRESWWNYEFWDLKNTTLPYQISKQNQNLSTPPTLNLWEFPNNGHDTTAYEPDELINKFEANYPGGILKDKRLITYVSHPRWFDVDGPKMRTVLNYLEDYRYENDKGPVIFITLEEAYKVWTQ